MSTTIGVRGEIDLGGAGMLSRQDWVEVRKCVFQAFQALSSHFEGVGKRRGELDSDAKMNQTKR